MVSLNDKWKASQNLKSIFNEKYENSLQELIHTEIELTEENLTIFEQAVFALGEYYSKTQNPIAIQNLLKENKKLFNSFPKAKTAKIIKNLIDYVSKIPNTIAIQVELCTDLINWCKEEKRTYLRHRVEIRLANLYALSDRQIEALQIIEPLLKEIRKADDKHLLVEIQLIESKVQHSLENFAKAKASLTASRACANSIYCPPLLQAEIDLMSGILNAEDRDFKTAYSYFYESFEAFNSFEDAKAIFPLKYMILSKIMTNSSDDVYAILNGKFGLKYAGRELGAMREITDAHTEKSLRNFQLTLQKYEIELKSDLIIKHHIKSLYENLLEQNLFRVIEPYSRVQIDHIADQVNLPSNDVQIKLSEMILDKKFEGTLDQGTGSLIIFDETKCDNLYANGTETIKNLNLVVEKLFEKTKKLKN